MEKVKTLLGANLHALVDSGLKANSVAVVDQYIRQIKGNLESLRDALVTIGGQVKTLRRRHVELSGKAKKLDRDIDILLGEGKEELAAAAQRKLNSVNHLIDSYSEQRVWQERECESLSGAYLKVEAKLAMVMQERGELQALQDVARSKEITVKAIESLGDLAGAGDVDVARVAESIRERLDRASVRTEMLAGQFDEQVDEMLGRREIDAQLAERKARIAAES